MVRRRVRVSYFKKFFFIFTGFGGSYPFQKSKGFLVTLWIFGKERKGKERKGKERKGKERTQSLGLGVNFLLKKFIVSIAEIPNLLTENSIHIFSLQGSFLRLAFIFLGKQEQSHN